MTTTTTKTLVGFQIHPNPSPKLISLQVIAGINFLASQSYPVVEECSEESIPGLDVRSLVAKSGPGKQSLYFVLKRKGGILVKSPVFRLFLPFFIQIYNQPQNC